MAEPRHLTRRQFFARGATAAAGLAASACQTEDPFALEKPPVPGAERWTRFEEKTLASACAQCAAGCGIRVRVVEGRAVKIEGQPENPINRGGIGPRGLSGLQALYDPDRLHGPLRRKGPRGSTAAASWQPISWEEAQGELAERLRGLREKGEARRLAIVCGRERGLMRELWQRFASAYGTPNFFDTGARDGAAVAQACFAMQGVRELPAYHWEDTRYVLSLGAGILEASCQSITFARAAAWLKRGNSQRGKIVQVEPSRSRTGASADEWIQIAPGSQAAFALGLAHVLVRDGLHDRSFVEEHAFGFEDWTDESGAMHRGFRGVLDEYPPDRVAELCDVEAATIERIARELARTRPGFAITDSRATQAPNGLQTAMAAHALNALLGVLERPGGVLVQRSAPLAPWPELALDAAAEAGLASARVDGVGAGRFPLATSVPEALGDALLSGEPYPLDTVLLYYANPCYAWTNPERWRRALAAAPFVATFTPFLDETAAQVADLILPDHSYLERFEDAAPAPATGSAIFGLRQPVVEPLHDTRATGDVAIALAKSLGGSCGEAFPWKDFREAVLRRALGLAEASGGSIRASSAKKFLAALQRESVWYEEEPSFEHWDAAFATPSGRFEFFSQRLRRELAAAAERSGRSVPELLASWGIDADPDLACLPHYAAPRFAGKAAEYPLLLEPFKPGTYAQGSGANLPLLQELVTEPGGAAWTTSAYLHPTTAAPLGIVTGDRIAIESSAGAIEVRASVRANVHPGSVRIAQGGGHTAFGRFAQGMGANPLELVASEIDALGGFPVILGNRVRVRRVSS